MIIKSTFRWSKHPANLVSTEAMNDQPTERGCEVCVPGNYNIVLKTMFETVKSVNLENSTLDLAHRLVRLNLRGFVGGSNS